MRLNLERRAAVNRTATIPVGLRAAVSLAPAVDEGYWTYRVRLTDRQSVVGFPKFDTIGIGFAVESDWNTNLPYTVETIGILSHIWHNLVPGGEKRPGPDEDFPDDDSPDDVPVIVVHRAIEMIQEAATEDRPGRPGMNTQPAHQPYGWQW